MAKKTAIFWPTFDGVPNLDIHFGTLNLQIWTPPSNAAMSGIPEAMFRS